MAYRGTPFPKPVSYKDASHSLHCPRHCKACGTHGVVKKQESTCAQCVQYAKELRQMQTQLVTACHERDAATARADAAQAKLNAYEQEMSERGDVLEELRRHLAHVQSLLERQKLEGAELKARLEKSEEECASVRKELLVAHERADGLEERLKRACEEHECAMSELRAERERMMKEMEAKYEAQLADERKASQEAFEQLQAKHRQLASDSCEQKLYWEYWKQDKKYARGPTMGNESLKDKQSAQTGNMPTSGDFVLSVDRLIG